MRLVSSDTSASRWCDSIEHTSGSISGKSFDRVKQSIIDRKARRQHLALTCSSGAVTFRPSSARTMVSLNRVPSMNGKANLNVEFKYAEMTRWIVCRDGSREDSE